VSNSHTCIGIPLSSISIEDRRVLAVEGRKCVHREKCRRPGGRLNGRPSAIICAAVAMSGEIKRKLAGPKRWMASAHSSISNRLAIAGRTESAMSSRLSATTEMTRAREARSSSH